MSRRHGETRQDQGARELAQSIGGTYVSAGPAEILVSCRCSAYPLPHVHSDFDVRRERAIFEAQCAGGSVAEAYARG